MRMRSLFAAVCTAALSTTGMAQEQASQNFDVVVYGGTAAGAATAIAAASQGKSVALLEPGNHIGGMVSGGLGRTDRGNHRVIGGFPLEFYHRLGKHYGHRIEWYPEPHVAEKVLADWLNEAGVKVFKQHRLQEKTGCDAGTTAIRSVTMENGAKFIGKVFADCTYEGDLMAQAGIKYVVGREGQKEFNEELAGVREKTPKHQFLFNVKARDAQGKLLPEVQEGDKGEPGAGDHKVQAYNFRLCLTTNPLNQVPFPKPPKYDAKRYQLLATMLNAWSEQTTVPLSVTKLMHPGPIANGKTDTNNNGAFSTDYIGANYDYPDADYKRRQEIWDDHYEYVAGFLYFLANDPQVPEDLRKQMNRWGLAKDEFTDTNNWPHQLYVREGRRMRGEYVMHQADIQTSRTKEDSIGMGSYNSDSHNVARIENAQGFAENEGDMQVAVKPYEIPYRIVLPKKDQKQNLLVPVCLSATHVTYSTVRMEPQYMLIGEAAGIAAAMAIDAGKPVQDIDVPQLQAKLRERGGILSHDEAAKKFARDRAAGIAE